MGRKIWCYLLQTSTHTSKKLATKFVRLWTREKGRTVSVTKISCGKFSSNHQSICAFSSTTTGYTFTNMLFFGFFHDVDSLNPGQIEEVAKKLVNTYKDDL